MNPHHSLFAHAALQQPATPTTAGAAADDRAQAFRAVQGGNELQSGEKLLVEAYAAIWLIIFGLVFLSWRRQKQIDRRIDALEAAVQKARAGSGQGTS
ncbi:CcmD family protein [Sorangium cellulosum]|uniref:CcmD family protein n=1 Tax=Sorangium cellulosum TaxID=56 RepID=A0A2L0ERC8_SORCE|nr:CcmD family protein [Sorangium cellulosum]AUX41867.1 CcmD family protein [Sorangium cellulosum]